MSRESMPARKRIGRVSLFEHHGTWWIYYRQQGKAVRRSVGDAALAECEASLLNAKFVAEDFGLPLGKLLAERFQSHLVQPGMASPTASPLNTAKAAVDVALLRSRFLAHHELVLKSAVGTLSRYSSATLYLENFARERSINDATAVSAAPFIAYLRSLDISPNGHRNTIRRKLADKGVRYIAECCRSLYHFGINQDLMPVGTGNPFSGRRSVPIQIRDAKQIFLFDADREAAFFTAARPWTFAVHFVLAKTGLRPGELVHLLIEDLDLAGGWLLVRGKPEVGWTTKTGTERRVPLLPEVLGVLRERIGGRKSGVVFLRERLAVAGVRSPLLTGDRAQLAFVVRQRLLDARNKKEQPLTRREEARLYEQVWQDAGAILVDRIRTSFIRAARAAELTGATCPKSWRHTFATLLQQANVDVLVRQETLGHKPSTPGRSALGMTGVYTHTAPDFQRREIERALRLRPGTLMLAQHHIAPAIHCRPLLQ
jgi:integrase